MKRFYSILLLALFALSSCGDEEVTGPNQHDFMPGETGSWYVSKTTAWDINGDTTDAELGAWQILGSDIEYQGREDVFFFLKWDIQMLEFDEDSLIRSNSPNGIYSYRSPASFAGLSEHEFSRRWIKIADFGTEDAWTTVDTNLSNVVFTINGQQYTGSGRVLQKISPNEESVIVFSNLGGTAVLARCFAQVTFYDFTLDVNGQPTKLEFSDIENFCIARDRGTVKRRREAYLIPFGSQEIEINGFETLMAASHAN